ncbi:MAG: ADP-ribosylglycohydrolase family protein [Lachnospiraceae bacterium]|jgi:ADP-ribosylglycohydrolase|nr:ADP-ribosylglycohydrolase family protein [Lachnospiraceae bacterium]
MNKEEYRNRVNGCWMGKNIGGTLGMPMEWERSRNQVTYYTHDLDGKPLPNDDLDIQILWLLALEDKGIHIDAKTMGEYFNEFMIFTHAEYGVAKTNLRTGFQPPVTGSFNNDFKDSCGSYIRAEIWACLFPGKPEKAAEYAFEDAIIDHGDGEGVYAEIFIAVMESAAFYIKDIRKLIEIGLSYIPEAVHFGEDTDCTAGTIASLFGIMYGVDFFEKKWTEPIGSGIVTYSIDPFRMAGRIPATVEEFTERVFKQKELAWKELGLAEKEEEGKGEENSWYAKPYFQNLYDEMKNIRYEFPYLNVRVDYCGEPVITQGEPKKIKLVLSNTSKSLTADRVNVYLYSRDGCIVMPQNEVSVFLTMAHMGAGIKEVEFQVCAEGPLKPIYRFVAEFIFEENKNRKTMHVPLVLVSQMGTVREVKWEKKGPHAVNNLPRI